MLSLKDFEELWELADKRAKICKVKRTVLQRLLMDHSKLLVQLADAGITLEDGYADSSHTRKARK